MGEGIGRLGKPASAVWLREGLVEAGSGSFPGREPVVVHEWVDPYPVRGNGEPVGYRHLVLVALGGGPRADPSGIDRVLRMLGEAGWTARRPFARHGESWAPATCDAFEARVYQGAGPGILYVTGWTPVVFGPDGRQRIPPRETMSTVWGAVLCDECEGMGACPECEGTGYAPHTFRRRPGSYSGYGCLECCAYNTGPGNCSACGVRGSLPVEVPYWEDGRLHRVTQAVRDREPQPIATNAEALAEVVRRACTGCGEVRCGWRNAVVETGGEVLSHYFGICPRCGVTRVHAFLSVSDRTENS